MYNDYFFLDNSNILHGQTLNNLPQTDNTVKNMYKEKQVYDMHILQVIISLNHQYMYIMLYNLYY